MSENATFDQLKGLLSPYEKQLKVISDSPGSYYLDTYHIMKNKKSLFFAAVKINKRYISFHLMPVYVFPDLLDNISPELRKRMQGKSCFNFTQIDESILSQLRDLITQGYEAYQKAGYIEN